MNFFKRYLFKKALLEDDLANDERRRKEIVIEKQPEAVLVVEPKTVTEEVAEIVPEVKADIGGNLTIPCLRSVSSAMYINSFLLSF